MQLFGLAPSNSTGSILEVHLDIQNHNANFDNMLSAHGFENDPFEVFFPAGYQEHRTGRILVPKKEITIVLPKIRALVEHVIIEAKHHEVELYAEIEIVRGRHRFLNNDSSIEDEILDHVELHHTNQFGGADADIHLEFLDGTVSPRVRSYLESKGFYWVKTPPTKLFPSEEIATLQTEFLGDAKRIFNLLIESPFKLATCIHLEQKLGMIATRADLLMPQVIRVQF